MSEDRPMRPEVREIVGKAVYDTKLQKICEIGDIRVTERVPYVSSYEAHAEVFKEMYRAEGEAAVRAYFDREDYRTLRNEVWAIISALLNNQPVSLEAQLKLGIFMAWTAGATES